METVTDYPFRDEVTIRVTNAELMASTALRPRPVVVGRQVLLTRAAFTSSRGRLDRIRRESPDQRMPAAGRTRSGCQLTAPVALYQRLQRCRCHRAEGRLVYSLKIDAEMEEARGARTCTPTGRSIPKSPWNYAAGDRSRPPGAIGLFEEWPVGVHPFSRRPGRLSSRRSRAVACPTGRSRRTLPGRRRRASAGQRRQAAGGSDAHPLRMHGPESGDEFPTLEVGEISMAAESVATPSPPCMTASFLKSRIKTLHPGPFRVVNRDRRKEGTPWPLRDLQAALAADLIDAYSTARGPLRAGTDVLSLDRYVSGRDEAAFAQRWSSGTGRWSWPPAVASTCEPNDAEDAFQATFLILKRKAGSDLGRRPAGLLALQGDAGVAVQANIDAGRRREVERSGRSAMDGSITRVGRGDEEDDRRGRCTRSIRKLGSRSDISADPPCATSRT